MTSKLLIPVLVAMMLLTGVCNTLLTKYQDLQCVRNCDDPKRRHNFEQPVWQTAQMFVGEMGCWLVVAGGALYNRITRARSGYEPVGNGQPPVDGSEDEQSPSDDDENNPARKPLVAAGAEQRPLRGWRVILLALPACCDLTGTTLMNVGLVFVAASIYQMTRGALVLFVGIFSVMFLRRYLGPSKWVALVIVVLGVMVVGLAGVVEQKNYSPIPGDPHPKIAPPMPSYNFDGGSLQHLLSRDARAAPPRPSLSQPTATSKPGNSPLPPDTSVALQTILGIFLIFLAQVFTASQFVVEEAIMRRYTLTPLTVVSWEGTFGLGITILLQVILHYTYGVTAKGRGGFFDARTGWDEIRSHTPIWASSLLVMLSIGGFNFFGLSVTRSVSATSRSTIDTCRTLFIWVVSLGLGWESFKWLQVLGFAMLVYGTFLFNEIVRPPGAWVSDAAWLRRRAVRPAAVGVVEGGAPVDVPPVYDEAPAGR